LSAPLFEDNSLGKDLQLFTIQHDISRQFRFLDDLDTSVASAPRLDSTATRSDEPQRLRDLVDHTLWLCNQAVLREEALMVRSRDQHTANLAEIQNARAHIMRLVAEAQEKPRRQPPGRHLAKPHHIRIEQERIHLQSRSASLHSAIHLPSPLQHTPSTPPTTTTTTPIALNESPEVCLQPNVIESSPGHQASMPESEVEELELDTVQSDGQICTRTLRFPAATFKSQQAFLMYFRETALVSLSRSFPYTTALRL
jgi:hypothetical protein